MKPTAREQGVLTAVAQATFDMAKNMSGMTLEVPSDQESTRAVLLTDSEGTVYQIDVSIVKQVPVDGQLEKELSYREATGALHDEVSSVKGALNKLCNRLDRIIIEDSKRLSGHPFSGRTILHGRLGVLWAAISDARAEATSLKAAYQQEFVRK